MSKNDPNNDKTEFIDKIFKKFEKYLEKKI
jgi:hypothetical protein